MQHHTRQRAARAFAAMRTATARRFDQPVALKRQTNPVVRALAAVLADQLLPEMIGREVIVAGLEQRQDCHHLVNRRPPGRGSTKPAVIKTLRALSLIAIAPAPEGPLRDTQDLRGLLLAQLTAVATSIND